MQKRLFASTVKVRPSPYVPIAAAMRGSMRCLLIDTKTSSALVAGFDAPAADILLYLHFFRSEYGG